MSSHFEERVHGGFTAVGAGFVDLSTNLNPYGPCEPVLAAARAAALDTYPDPKALRARSAWAARFGVSPEEVAVGHGAADLFWAIARANLRAADRVVIAGPTFSEIDYAARAAGAAVEHVALFDRAESKPALSGFIESARGARLVYLCTPNNPTGHYVTARNIQVLAEQLKDSLIVVDQAFLTLSDHASELSVRFGSNVICVRSLTKDFALAGLRIAYLLAAPEVVARIERARPTWATSQPALAAIEVAASEQDFVAQSYARLAKDRLFLDRGLRALGLQPWPSCTAFTLVPVEDALRTTALLHTRGVGVRDASSFGLPRHVRVAVRPRVQTERLLDALRSIRSDKGSARATV